jgi:two-component system, OmpR family, sensor histidine kinase TrcS
MDTIASQTRKLKQFVTHASHELKTPLMTISSSVDLMTRSGISTPQTQTIKQTTSSMKALIDHLMATMRDDVLQTKELDMAILIRDIVDRVSASHHHTHKLDLSIADPLIKHADQMICESIITNLVDNAHKYAVAGTTIEIIANAKQFMISNHIDPLSTIDLEQIWQPFYQ